MSPIHSSRAPAGAAKAALIVGPLLYLLSRAPAWFMGAESANAGGLTEWLYDYASMSFLYHMFIIFIVLCGLMLVWGSLAPADERPLPRNEVVDMRPMRGLHVGSMVLLLCVGGLYLVFW